LQISHALCRRNLRRGLT